MHFSTVRYKLNGLSSTDVQSCWTAVTFHIILMCKDNLAIAFTLAISNHQSVKLIDD